MSVKFVKVRFNTENARDMEIYSALNGMDGQNRFIKEAIQAYLNRESDEAIAERIVAALLPKLGKIRFEAPSEPTSITISDEPAADSTSISIADDFLDSL